MIKVQAPARICFFGDHQDYLNLPVIAGTINRFIHIEGELINEKSYSIHLVDIEEFRTIDLNKKIKKIQNGDYLLSVLEVLKKAGFFFNQGYKIKIFGDIPINAGISSSSAFVVAWIRFLIATQDHKNKVTDEQIGRWAYEAESQFFNEPGGLMDQYTIAQRGLLYIDTKTTQTERLNPDIGTLVIAESGIAKKTLSVLENARAYGQASISAVKKKFPEFDIYKANELDYKKYLAHVPKIYQDHWYASIFNYILTQKAKKILTSGPLDLKKLGALMDSHQKILQEKIQNTPDKMKLQMQAARNAGALGTKIIGSGGGGCMVAIVSEESKENVIQAFLNNGVKAAYEINLITPV